MKFGDLEIFSVSDGLFRLDGGAMFGVVPKVLWQRTNPADDKNRIQLGLNCMLIKTANDLILVDSGIGDFHDDKFKGMFAIDHTSHSLLDDLAKSGFKAEDITKVILTHLHFDHSGNNCRETEGGEVVPTFSNATYFFQEKEYEYASNPDPRSKASYLARNWQAVAKANQLEIISGDIEIVPGVRVEITGGHTRDHQIVKVVSAGKTACFLADLAPTTSHLKTPYVMGYDLYPKTTMEVKERVLQQALAENWLLFFEHDPVVRAGYLRQEDGKMKIEAVEVD